MLKKSLLLVHKFLFYFFKVLPSPSIHGYRNKCEFTIGQMTTTSANIDKSITSKQACVGFVSGKMVDQTFEILSVLDCPNLSQNTRNIVKNFEQFIRNFDARLKPFHEYSRMGFWKMLTVRDFVGDCMLIITVHPNPENQELVESAKKAVIEYFLSFKKPKENIEFHVTSIYWQTLENASDKKIFEHLEGKYFLEHFLLKIGLNKIIFNCFRSPIRL